MQTHGCRHRAASIPRCALLPSLLTCVTTPLSLALLLFSWLVTRLSCVSMSSMTGFCLSSSSCAVTKEVGWGGVGRGGGVGHDGVSRVPQGMAVCLVGRVGCLSCITVWSGCNTCCLTAAKAYKLYKQTCAAWALWCRPPPACPWPCRSGWPRPSLSGPAEHPGEACCSASPVGVKTTPKGTARGLGCARWKE